MTQTSIADDAVSVEDSMSEIKRYPIETNPLSFEGESWGVTISDLCANGIGATEADARESARQAPILMIESLRKEGELIPEPSTMHLSVEATSRLLGLSLGSENESIFTASSVGSVASECLKHVGASLLSEYSL